MSLYIHIHLSIYLYIPAICPQLCPTLCDPRGCSLPGSSVTFSRQEYWSGLPFPFPGDLPHPGVKPMSPALAGGFFATEPLGKSYQLSECMLSSLSHVWLFATLWTIALQAPLSMGFSRQEFWSGLQFPPPISYLPICLFINVITLMKANVL